MAGDPSNVVWTATGTRITETRAECNNSVYRRQPLTVPNVDLYGEPLDRETRSWGLAIVRAVKVWQMAGNEDPRGQLLGIPRRRADG